MRTSADSRAQTGKPELLVIPRCPRPDHFLRPSKDDAFAATGEFTYTRAVGAFLPEDVLHCAHAITLTTLLRCPYRQLPVARLYGNYQLVPGRFYALHRERPDSASPLKGTLRIWNSEAHFVTHDSPEAHTGRTTDSLDWPSALAHGGLLILPMFWRAGAAVWLDDGRALGCLVPGGDDAAACNFDPGEILYHALAAHGAPPRALEPIYVVENVVRTGTALWIAPRTPAWEALLPRFPSHARADQDLRAVRALLNVPPGPERRRGKLYVTVMQRPRVSSGAGMLVPQTIEVDPWELVPVGAEGLRELPDVMLEPRV